MRAAARRTPRPEAKSGHVTPILWRAPDGIELLDRNGVRVAEVDGRVVHEICTTLAHLDHEGHTLAAGATSIASSTGRAATRKPTDSAGRVARGTSHP